MTAGSFSLEVVRDQALTLAGAGELTPYQRAECADRVVGAFVVQAQCLTSDNV